jgi:hypothetical protein
MRNPERDRLTTMPYELSFTRRVPLLARDEYINECCVGGDAVAGHLLPAIQSRYHAAQMNQEDWGWFIWCRKDAVALAVDIFTDDPDEGTFRIHLTSRIKKWILLDSVRDTPELEELRTLVVTRLEPWVNGSIKVKPLDPDYSETIEDQ